MNTVSLEPLKIVTSTNKPLAPLTATTKRMMEAHSWRKRLGRFFGGTANCAVLDITWNVAMTYFLSRCALIFCKDDNIVIDEVTRLTYTPF